MAQPDNVEYLHGTLYTCICLNMLCSNNKTLGSCKWQCNYGQEVKPKMVTQIVQHSLIKRPAACFVFMKYVVVVYRLT